MIKEVLEALGENGEHWVKNAYHELEYIEGNMARSKRTGNICMVGAAEDTYQESKNNTFWGTGYSKFQKLVKPQIINLFPERVASFGLDDWDVEFFNDHEDTTFEDIRLVLKHAERAEDELS